MVKSAVAVDYLELLRTEDFSGIQIQDSFRTLGNRCLNLTEVSGPYPGNNHLKSPVEVKRGVVADTGSHLQRLVRKFQYQGRQMFQPALIAPDVVIGSEGCTRKKAPHCGVKKDRNHTDDVGFPSGGSLLVIQAAP